MLGEPETEAIRSFLSNYDAWWSSEVLMIELRRLGAREGLAAPAEEMLESFRLVPIDSAAVERASRITPTAVRSLDAIHLEAAIQLHERDEINGVVTYDRQLQNGCDHHGLSVHAPAAA